MSLWLKSGFSAFFEVACAGGHLFVNKNLGWTPGSCVEHVVVGHVCVCVCVMYTGRNSQGEFLKRQIGPGAVMPNNSANEKRPIVFFCGEEQMGPYSEWLFIKICMTGV